MTTCATNCLTPRDTASPHQFPLIAKACTTCRRVKDSLTTARMLPRIKLAWSHVELDAGQQFHRNSCSTPTTCSYLMMSFTTEGSNMFDNQDGLAILRHTLVAVIVC